MLQVYLLSIVSNFLVGLVLAGESIEDKFPSYSSFRKLLEPVGFRGLLGTLAFIVALITLILPAGNGSTLILGDLFPAIGGLVGGFSLMLEFYNEKATTSSALIEKLDTALLGNKNIIGIANLFVGVLHFLLPGFLFL